MMSAMYCSTLMSSLSVDVTGPLFIGERVMECVSPSSAVYQINHSITCRKNIVLVEAVAVVAVAVLLPFK